MSEVNLPEGWFQTTLENIANWGSGGTPSRKETTYYRGNIPWIKTGDLGPRVLHNSTEFISKLAVQNSSAKLFPKGSVAIAMYGATIGKTSIFGIDATTNQACGVGNPIEGVTFSEFLYYFLLNEKDNFIAKGKGGAQPNISQTLIKDHECVLPPLAEQKVIADKLDTLLAKVEITKARLDRIPKILKTFRQSVLTAAVSGKLTEETSFTDRELTSLKNIGNITGGKTPSKSNPNFWQNGDIPWVSPKDMKTDFIENSIDQITDLAINEAGMRLLPKKTLLMVTRSGILAHSFPVALTKVAVTINQDIKAFIVNERLVKAEYCLYLIKGLEQRILVECSKAGTTVPSVETRLLENLNFELPSLEEQIEIVRRVEELFSFADRIEQKANAALDRVNNLTQSILAKAFRGELTEQWRAANPDLISGDNSAEALLAKIKAEREKLSKKPKKKK